MLLALEMEVMPGKVAALDQDLELKGAPLPLLEGKLLVLGHKRMLGDIRWWVSYWIICRYRIRHMFLLSCKV